MNVKQAVYTHYRATIIAAADNCIIMFSENARLV